MSPAISLWQTRRPISQSSQMAKQAPQNQRSLGTLGLRAVPPRRTCTWSRSRGSSQARLKPPSAARAPPRRPGPTAPLPPLPHPPPLFGQGVEPLFPPSPLPPFPPSPLPPFHPSPLLPFPLPPLVGQGRGHETPCKHRTGACVIMLVSAHGPMCTHMRAPAPPCRPGPRTREVNETQHARLCVRTCART